jgi:ABC-type transport system involved in cytochrome c biogenesis permease subunit
MRRVFSIVAALWLLLVGVALVRIALLEADHAPSIGFWLVYFLVMSAHFTGLLGWLRLPAPLVGRDYAVLIAYVIGTLIALMVFPNALRGGMLSRASAYCVSLIVWLPFAALLLIRVVRRHRSVQLPNATKGAA